MNHNPHKRKSRKKIIIVLIILALAGGGYYYYRETKDASTQIRYVLEKVRKGTLVVSVSGSGQVSALNQIDIKPDVSGKIVSVAKQNGDRVAVGEIIGNLDTADAQKTIRDADANLESANLQLSILKQSSANMPKLISDGFSEVSNTFLDLPTIISGVKAALYDSTIASYGNLLTPNDALLADPLINAAVKSYEEARASYDKAFADYHKISRYDSSSTIISFMAETLDVSTMISDAVKNMINLIDFVNDYNTTHNRTLPPTYANLLTSYKNNLSDYTSEINPHITNFISIGSSIINAPLNIASQELSVQKAENSLADAKEVLDKYTLTAPFAGILTKLNFKVGDSATPSTAVATLITPRRFAEISLNEVDVSKVKLLQKATLTFDAIEGLTIPGEVNEIDAIGTVSQGVVTYNVKVGFEAVDDRVKPGMSVSTAIITDTKKNIIIVPQSSIRSNREGNYVEVLDEFRNTVDREDFSIMGVISTVPPNQKLVTPGLSNDISTEITTGLNEGDVIIIRTITGALASPTQQTSSGFRFPGTGGTRTGGAAR